ncbi:polysaccharide chain length determinant protein (PEP-CTERM system associated) [Marinobacter sp. LV10R520-4]|uniref:XrtA system polysaccharide chain length determinant n=1 Tax=Marinobacter sp. LV10R520-4 TaxID=1761796 RepID=UPI000BF29287|nr:XrtA system polysaccharide chain length determinant [Marinobacter sp. LV10R520-4]PFG54833.1 polysaccharide chain length determinant protein (PEP-CTERM system associated) [Marinobacter sp. LV10R520-4]
MDLQFIIDILRAVKLELYRHRLAAAIVFMLVTTGILTMGYAVPKSYTSQALLYADQSNILKPLLKGKAEISQVDRINEAREMMQSRSFLEQVAFDTEIIKSGETDAVRNQKIKSLRGQVGIRESNQNFLELSYTSESPDRSFRVLSAVLTRFVERTERKRRSESQGAFDFIDSQVKTYQGQLEKAEERLKDFKSANQDGNENSALARIESLRREIENLKLEIQQTNNEVRLTRSQLSQEQPVRRITLDPGKSGAERRLASLRTELDTLMLRYHERHPDVVSAKSQIADLEGQVSGQSESSREGAVTEVMENPVYENLKLQLAESTTRLAVQTNRLTSLERLLEEAFERSQRVAENSAQFSELTRDYDVTRGVYEDMLQSREKARLSMTLDVQGEGISYKIQEPASYPTQWDGVQLYQVGLASPFLGSATVLGLLVLLVMLDQRVRSPRALQMALPESIPVLTTIPHYRSTWKDRMLRKDVLAILFVLAVFMTAYLFVLVFKVLGMTPEELVNKAGELTELGLEFVRSFGGESN